MNSIERHVAHLAVAHYREKIREIERIKELLSKKKFKYGDYVVKKGTSYFDSLLGAVDGVVGKVVWFDEANNYYRVRYNNHACFIGTKEEQVELYEGEVPQHLVDYNIEDKLYIQFEVEEK